mgnify:CR=1 FL=1
MFARAQNKPAAAGVETAEEGGGAMAEVVDEGMDEEDEV